MYMDDTELYVYCNVLTPGNEFDTLHWVAASVMDSNRWMEKN